MRVAFLHPDLGIGGAERLVVDAAVGLQARGHGVHMFTSHWDPSHCFPETLDRLSVSVHGDWLPTKTLGMAHALWANVRAVYLTLAFLLLHRSGYDVVFADQVSMYPLLLRLVGVPVLFYCHFPDKLLSKPGGLAKQAYRLPLDALERAGIAAASLVCVNSRFTRGVLASAFPGLTHSPAVLYPCIPTAQLDQLASAAMQEGSDAAALVARWRSLAENLVVSINRFERKKNLPLVLRAAACLRDHVGEDDPRWCNTHFVLAGGYDTRVSENVQHYDELEDLVASLRLQGHVSLQRNIAEADKVALLMTACCTVYTPSFEHFGIVPVEAMYLTCPVIAVDNGGPTESIVDGETGFLCPAEATPFASAILECVSSADLVRRLGDAGRARANAQFSRDSFAEALEQYLESLVTSRRK